MALCCWPSTIEFILRVKYYVHNTIRILVSVSALLREAHGGADKGAPMPVVVSKILKALVREVNGATLTCGAQAGP